MFISSLAALSFASILSILPPTEPNMTDIESGATIVRYSSPAMAGLWELDTSPMKPRSITHSTRSSFDNEVGLGANNLDSEVLSHIFIQETMTQKSMVEDVITDEVITDDARLEGVMSEKMGQLEDYEQSTITEEKRIVAVSQSPNSQLSEQVADTVLPDSMLLSSDGTQCVERYNFSSQNKMWTVSGAEWTQGEYVVQPISEDPNTLPLLVIQTLYDNNEPDCAGNKVDQTGGVLAVYLDYRPEEQRMYWCKDPRGKECIMHFKRVLP